MMEKGDKKYEFTLPVGTILTGGKNTYHVDDVLGQGGYGTTYLASCDIKVGRTIHRLKFAIKEFFAKGICYRESGNAQMLYSPAAKLEVEEGLKDFKNEARRLALICEGNENIVNVNEVFEDNSTAYYVMEYLEGNSLRDLVRQRKGKNLSEEETKTIIFPIAKAVAYIHQAHKLLHLDIKPDNIMMRKGVDGQPDVPVLIDFGITIHFNNKGNVTTTHKSTGCSEGYSPIEQYGGIYSIIEERKRLIRKGYKGISVLPSEVDVYALGATFYYCLVGKDPYNANTITPQIIERELRDRNASEAIVKAIKHAMASKASERTPSAEQFMKELDTGIQDSEARPLPNGYKLHLGNVDYVILGASEIGTYYIKYRVAKYVASKNEESGNLTIKKTYTVYEFFTKGIHSRNTDNSVVEKINIPASKEDFLTLARKKTGDGLTDTSNPASHIFTTNGTLYFIEMEKPPVPPKPKWKWILVSGIIIISLGINMLRMCDGKKTEDSPKEVDTVSKIEVKKDSGTTVKPIIEKKENNDKKEVVETKKAEDTNTEEPVQAKMTEEEIYTVALQANDWKSMRNLAKRSYTPACGALAKHYVNDIEYPTQTDLCKAYYWALKSSDKDRVEVINSLKKQYFFASDGQPAYPCDNIDY